jgi:hypothetical protein
VILALVGIGWYQFTAASHVRPAKTIALGSGQPLPQVSGEAPMTIQVAEDLHLLITEARLTTTARAGQIAHMLILISETHPVVDVTPLDEDGRILLVKIDPDREPEFRAGLREEDKRR